ncbi:MAG: hypothetical protein V1859_04010 [archaeon]
MTDPPRAGIRLGYNCNHNRKFCCVSDHRKENMSTSEALSEIKKAKEFGAEKLVFIENDIKISKFIMPFSNKQVAYRYTTISATCYTGGEPTIRKYTEKLRMNFLYRKCRAFLCIVKLVSYGKELGFSRILIITNSEMCSYQRFLDRLISSWLTDICFSMPHTDEAVYDRFALVN